MSSVLMNQQIILNWNTHKTKLHVNWLRKLWPEAFKNLTLYFFYKQNKQNKNTKQQNTCSLTNPTISDAATVTLAP